MFDLDSALGIEVRRNQLVFCIVSKGLQGFTWKTSQVIDQYRDLEPSELQSRLQQMLHSNGFNRENVILGLSRDQVVVHVIELPSEVEENLDQVVQFQAAKLDPSEEESSCYDYVVLSRNEKEGNLLLQIVMVPQTAVDRLLQLFRELNLYPAAIRASSLGLHQLLKIHQRGFGDLPDLFLTIEPDSIEIVLANGPGQCLPHHRQLIPGEEPSLDLLQAELDAFLSRLPIEAEACGKIYLLGSKGEDFVEPLLERYGDTELLSRGLKVKAPPPDGDPSVEFMHALGLAVSGLTRSNYSSFNLIPRNKRLLGQRASWIPTLALAGLLVLMLVLVGTRSFFQQRQLLDALDREVTQLQPQVEEAIQSRQRAEAATQKAAELHAMMAGRQRVLELLRELTEIVPENVYLQNLIIQREKVTLTGYSDGEASGLLPILFNSDLIANAESRYITTERTTGKQKFNFELTLQEGPQALP